jgi:hypothetical protein
LSRQAETIDLEPEEKARKRHLSIIGDQAIVWPQVKVRTVRFTSEGSYRRDKEIRTTTLNI